MPDAKLAAAARRAAGRGTPEYTNHVHIADKNGYSHAPIFDDLYGCNLPAISWVVPDQKWSDHPYDPGNSQSSFSLGPYWVGDIINGVGTACGGKYWGGSEPTAIFVVWDDWGGWYDHIKPWAYYRGTPSSCTGFAPNNWGCGYVAGFRVPLMVVSAYTGTPGQNGVTGYVSGACNASTCPNMQPQFTHDFGSILGFTEWNFGMPFIDGPPDDGYADYNAPDWPSDHKTAPPLADFFQLTQPRTFVPVPTAPWPYNCFTAWGTCTGQEAYVAEDPDDY